MTTTFDHTDWLEAQEIADSEKVDELFRAFSEDSTNDTAVMIVREVLRMYKQKALTSDEHPMQPILMAPNKVIRFKKNQIVADLLDHSGGFNFGMTEIAMKGYSLEDRNQFAQLIGYSVSGWGDLSYAKDVKKADAIAATVYDAK